MRYWPLTAVLLAFWFGRETGAESRSDQVQDVVRSRRFELVGPQGLPRGGWYVNDQSETVLEVKIRNGTVRLVAAAGGDARIELANAGETFPVTTSIWVEERGQAGLAVVDRSGKQRVRLGLERSGGTSFELCAENGRAVVGMWRGKRREVGSQGLFVRTSGVGPSASIQAVDDGGSSIRLLGYPHRAKSRRDRRGIHAEVDDDGGPTLRITGEGAGSSWRFPEK